MSYTVYMHVKNEISFNADTCRNNYYHNNYKGCGLGHKMYTLYHIAMATTFTKYVYM